MVYSKTGIIIPWRGSKIIKLLIKESESHVIVFFLLRFFLFLLLLSSRSSSLCSSTRSRSGGASTATSSKGSELACSGGYQLIDRLALGLSDNNLHQLCVTLDTHRGEDFFDVSGTDFFAGQGSKEGCSNVTHF